MNACARSVVVLQACLSLSTRCVLCKMQSHSITPCALCCTTMRLAVPPISSSLPRVMINIDTLTESLFTLCALCATAPPRLASQHSNKRELRLHMHCSLSSSQSSHWTDDIQRQKSRILHRTVMLMHFALRSAPPTCLGFPMLCCALPSSGVSHWLCWGSVWARRH